jgi:ABC-type branched-subunit amino acid transport system substrate-binding protein
MHMTHGTSIFGKAVLAGATLAAGLVILLGGSAGAATSGAPGVTKNSITVGTISTQTGELAANFASLIYGEKAYFDYINSIGGINGRKINLKYSLDDAGNPTTFNQLASTLINQDHVFAVTGVATAFFSPNLFTEAKIPTYGYDVTENWAGPNSNNLFAAGGSVIYLGSEGVGIAYVMDKLHLKNIAFVAYGIAASANACQAGALELAAAGYHVSYTDFKINYPGTTVATDVQRMMQSGTQLVASCMDVQGNVTMARAIQQYGAHIKQLWFSGNDIQTLKTNESLMQGVYFDVFHVPFTASQSQNPGLALYLKEMNKYEPAYAQDEVAIQGWQSAALFAQGVKMAGKNLTQAAVINADNSLTDFTAGGLIPPVNWKYAGHSGHAPPYCGAFIVAKGDQYVPALEAYKNQVFVCFGSASSNHPKPETIEAADAQTAQKP